MNATKQKQTDEYRDVKVTQIDRAPDPVRFAVSPESVKELAESIMITGLIEPVIVRKRGKRYELIAGDRRLAAIKLLNRETIRCVIVKASDTEAEAMKLHENHKRLNLSPVEESVYFNFLVQKKGMKQSEIAKLLDVSEGYISQRLAIISWNEKLVDAIDSGQISFSAARELARITDVPVLERCIEQAVVSGVTPRVANLWWQDWLRDKNVDLTGKGEQKSVVETQEKDGISFNCSLCGEVKNYRELAYLRVCSECMESIRAQRAKTSVLPRRDIPDKR